MKRRSFVGTLFTASLFMASLACLAAGGPARAADDPVRIGYWSSGFSLGFGAVLQEGKFLEKEGEKADYRKFSEVAAPAQAVLAGSVDVAFGAPAAAAFNLSVQGAPVKVFLITQILSADMVVPADSKITKVSELVGKKVGMSRPGSTTYALVTALLDKNYGIPVSKFSVVPGNEGQLSQLILRGDLAASSLRSVTLSQLPKGSVRSLFGVIPEWKKLIKGDTPPPLAVAMTTEDYLKKNPKKLVAVVRAIKKAVAFGSKNPDKVADILVKAANMKPKAAKNYASVWDTGYIASFTDADIEALKIENTIFLEAGKAKAMAPDSLYVTGPFREAGGQ